MGDYDLEIESFQAEWPPTLELQNSELTERPRLLVMFMRNPRHFFSSLRLGGALCSLVAVYSNLKKSSVTVLSL